jgi:hypothetical protein
MKSFLAALIATFAFRLVACVHLFESASDIPESVPKKCHIALAQNITCDFLVTAGRAVAGRSLNNQLASSYCSSRCSSSIKVFQKKVIADCGDKEYKLWENSTLTGSGKTLADGLTWAHDLMCIKDE